MKRKAGFVLQAIGEDTYAVAVTPEAAGVGSMIKLNATAALLFTFLEDEHSEEECVALLTEKYAIDEGTARADIARFLAGLKEASLLA